MNEQHDTLLSITAEHRVELDSHKTELRKINEEVAQSQTALADGLSRQTHVTNLLNAGVESLQQRVQCQTTQLDLLSDSAVSLRTSMADVSSIGKQALSFLRTFPAGVRGLLQKILRSNLQIYWLLLSMQNNVAGSPTLLLESNIQFEDALGRVRQLPFEWFRHWEVGFVLPCFFQSLVNCIRLLMV